MNSNTIKKHIVNEISLMPEYHIDMFGEKDYKRMLSVSNWIRLGKKKLDNGEYIRKFLYAANTTEEFPVDFDIVATAHSDNERVFDIQYTFTDLHEKKEYVF